MTREVRARVVPRLEATLRTRLARYFLEARRRLEPAVAAAIEPIVEERTKARDAALLEKVDVRLRTLEWDAEARALRSILRPAYTVAGEEAVAAVGAELGIGSSFDLNDRELSRIEATLGSRITRINDVSRTRIAGRVVDGIEKGLSTRDIVLGVGPGRSDGRGGTKPTFDGVRSLVDSWGSTGAGGRGVLGPVGSPADRQSGAAPPLRSTRAYLIAQTETGNAFNRSAIESYRASGLVDFVEVFDGPDCGWSSHDDPDLAHGSIRSLANAGARSLSHPRCQRAFGASLRSREEAPSPFRGRKPDEVPGASPGLRPDDAQPLSGRRVPSAPAAISDPAKVAGEKLAREAAKAELEVSRILDDIRTEVGAEFDGFQYRLKAPIRIAEKAASDALENGIRVDQAVDGINDALRYTLNAPSGRYVSTVQRSIERLRAQGIELVERDGRPIFKNFWTKDGYQGVNAVFRTKSGVRFELQWGTPEQAAAKAIGHKLYEAQRVLAKTDPRYAKLADEMRDLWAPIHAARPVGVDDLDDWLVAFRRSSVDDVVAREQARRASLVRVEDDIRTLATHEKAYVVDDFGKILAELEDATQPAGVPFDDASFLTLRGATLTHNHPRAYQEGMPYASSLSPNDVILSLDGGAREVRAIGKGADFSMVFAPTSTPLIRRISVQAAIRTAELEVRTELTAFLDQAKREARERFLRPGSTDIRAYGEAVREAEAFANAEHWHRIWTLVASRVPGLDYNRTLRPGVG